MYSEGYNKLFWGMILIVFNFNLGPIDILPNFVGYMLIYSGLNQLSSQLDFYKKGMPASLVLTAVSLFELFRPSGTVNQGNSSVDVNIWLTPLTSITSLINLYLFYVVCKGIYLLSEQRGLQDLKENARVRYKVYFIVTAVFLVYSPFSLNLSKDYAGFMMIPVVINIISALFIMGLFRKSRELLKD